MKEEKTPDMDKLLKKIKRKVSLAITTTVGGKIAKALDLTKQAEALMEKLQGSMPSELEETHCHLLSNKALILERQGHVTNGFKVAYELLTVAGKYDNKWGLSQGHFYLANFYGRSNDLDKAFEHYDRSIILKEEHVNDVGEAMYLGWVLINAVEISVLQNDVERARMYLTRLEEIHRIHPNDPFITQNFKMGKALLLSASIRPRDVGKAEELCEELLKEGFTIIHIKFRSLKLLSKLLFVDLRMTNDSGIIPEIKALFPRLIELAQQYRSMIYLVDFYTIQGKLALLTFDIKTARRSFTQARRIAERHGYLLAASEISRVQEDLEHQLTKWEQLKKNNAPFSERMELARVNEHFNQEFQAHMIKKEQMVEEEVTVYKDLKTCLVCKGSAGGFNIYVCPQCNSIYCKGCAETVVEIENACWTCESPIDKARPSKPFEQEEEKISIESKDGKKKVEIGVPKKIRGDEKRRKF